MNIYRELLSLVLVLVSSLSVQGQESSWKPMQTVSEGGVMGERISLWRNDRLWYIADSGFLIDAFENRPGSHQWQGEHIGKWIHASTLAYLETKDEKLKSKIDEMVRRLIATQEQDGYMGTYLEDFRYTNRPETGVILQKNVNPGDKPDKSNWDIWTIRYNLFGLLFYERYFPDEKIVDACRKMADQLIGVYGGDKPDITNYGTRKGISAATVLESIIMLYERTKDEKYLSFAMHLLAKIEANPSLSIMATFLGHGSAVHPGEGKAYQLMSTLLGYIRMFQVTGEEQYLKTVTNAWADIKENHILVTGGAWSASTKYNGNQECFAQKDGFTPTHALVEGCSDATWIQMNLYLFELTGEAKYYEAAEKTLVNSLYGHQSLNGKLWCYYTSPNEVAPKYRAYFSCCASSQPRAMEMFSHNLVGKYAGHLLVNSFASASVALTDDFGGGLLSIEGDFPGGCNAKISLKGNAAKRFVLDFRIPEHSKFIRAMVNGRPVKVRKNLRGYYEIGRKWKDGDLLSVDYGLELSYTVQEGDGGRRWIAFNYGAMALAEKIYSFSEKEPLMDLKVTEKFVPADILETIGDTDNVSFKIKGTDIVLIPFYKATSDETGGPFTYFEISK